MIGRKWLKPVSLHLQHLLGQRIGQRVLVIESDDWGGIRMSSKRSFDKLVLEGAPIFGDAFCRFDCLEQVEDLEALADTLGRYKDYRGNHPVLTANYTMSNPDFDRIKQEKYGTYFYETFVDTLERKSPGVFSLTQDLINSGMLVPQFHGKDHVNHPRWLKSLREEDKLMLSAFEEEVFGIATPKFRPEYFMAAYDRSGVEGINQAVQELRSGVAIFQQTFGFFPETFIPPCYVAPKAVLDAMTRVGVRGLQGKIVHLYPNETGAPAYRKLYRNSGLNGERVDLVRNVFFEPSENPGFDWVGDSLRRIKVAFQWNRPAIISSHRVNFMGGIDPKNRKNGLLKLNELLSSVLKIYPDVLFMDSRELSILYQKKTLND